MSMLVRVADVSKLHIKGGKEMSNKRLYKSNRNRMIAGVCGGIAEYFNVDPTLIRLGFAAFSLFGGSGILLYIVCALVIPNEF